ncbi:HpcH/HpaI aldolase/citrate lyase family protein [Streptomyces pinistramenti]|uniref:HpcH/HpaI aldolase/citrate lyase family protein n=1 Tax=Streptomyces pinistramenti TaxID=2884812 RepID=UPI001D08A85A|nr:aldolase/citrate lyase family protein [Streptomyces pinistramenti]MCB5909061.1 hypothetical protein [Streptomyces pinistramenti]
MTARRSPATAPGGSRCAPEATRRLRPRHSRPAVPGSNPRFLEKAQGLPADQVFLDLEGACAPLAEEGARRTVVDALNKGDRTGRTRVVRVNDWTTQWTYRGVSTVVEGAGHRLDRLMLPKVQDAQQVVAPDLPLTQIEKTLGFDGKWGLHPGRVAAANEVFSPSQDDYDHAELILDAYEWCTSEAGGTKGSAMLGEEMIDAAGRKMALVIAGKGRAAGLTRTSTFEAPEA